MSEANSTKGFLLTRQWRESEAGQDLIFWIATDNGAVRIEVKSQESVFFIRATELRRVTRLIEKLGEWRHAKVALCGFDNEAMIACYFPTQRGLNTARSRLRPDVTVFEADVRPTDRYLMERFITAGIGIEGGEEKHLKHGVPVFTNPRLHKEDYIPDLSVISLDIETSYTENILYSIALQGESLNKVFMVGDQVSTLEYLEFLPDETSVIKAFLQFIAKVDPDVIIGWNVVGFDLFFLQQRCEELAIEFSLGRANEAVSWRTNSQRDDKNYALVPGRVVLDGIELLRTATYSFESFALDAVAMVLLGRGKLIDDVDDRAEEIKDLFAHDKIQLAKYNLEDCRLVSEIFDKTNLIRFAIERSRLTGLDLDRQGGSVAAFDFLYLPRLHRKGYVAPVVEDETPVASPGGFVLESIPNIYEHVIVLDFKSLYPSIIRTFNVDPLAMATAATDPSPIEGFRGAFFSRTEVILPGIIKELWAARDVAKKSGEAAMSQAIKIIMNSFYGVLGTPGCRFFDTRLVSSITLRGHQILQKTRDLIEDKGFTVIYGDTDSVFVHLESVNSNAEADEIGSALMQFLTSWWREYLREEMNVESCLEVEYETHFDKFLMPTVRGSEKGSKKRYAGMIKTEDGYEMVFKGLETVRSDWSMLAREFQRELYRKIFLGQPYEEFIADTVEQVGLGLCDAKLVLRKRLRRKLSEYQKNIPPHVRAARLAEEIRSSRGLRNQPGGWIEYIMTVNGAEPKAYLQSKIDYQFYIDKQLAPIADSILFFKSASLAQITDKQLGLF